MTSAAILASSWVEDLIERVGEPAVGALIALENVFPPIPSEVVLPFAGFQAASGNLNAVVAWVAATVGSVVGAYVLYGIGVAIGYDRLHDLAGRPWFLLFGRRDLERGARFFGAHGGTIVLVGRCVPFLRSIVSVPAGVHRMGLARFTLYTALGSGAWNAAFIAAGWHLGNRWDSVERGLRPAGVVVGALLLAGAAWTAWRKVREGRRSRAGASAK